MKLKLKKMVINFSFLLILIAVVSSLVRIDVAFSDTKQLPSMCDEYIYALDRILTEDLSERSLTSDSFREKNKREIQRRLETINDNYNRCLYSKTPVDGTAEYYMLSGYLGVFILKFNLRPVDHKKSIQDVLLDDYRVLVKLVNRILESGDLK